MPMFIDGIDDTLLVDSSVPINGVNNSIPPSAIPKSLAAQAKNRLSQRDGLNRPRPGWIRLKQLTGLAADSIHHLGLGVFLVNNGPNWYTYNNRTNTLSTLSGGPAYPFGAQVYAALCNDVLYFSCGTTLNKYTVSSGTFGVVTLPTPYTTASCPIQAVNRLIYLWPDNNTIVVSDILDWEVFDPITQSLTIDPLKSDSVVGQSLWQGQRIAVFRNGSTYVVETGPNLAVVDWGLSRVSATIGCAAHGSIMQVGSDVYFLSETGRGVYQLSQAPTSDQQGVWLPLSGPVQRYMDRINWAAVKCARATYWNDLYRLSVPLDGASYNNFELVYSVSLDTWQGRWCQEIGGIDTSPRDFARDRSDPDHSVLLNVTRDGTIARSSYPADRQYYDLNIDGSQEAIESDVLSRSFVWGADQDINQVQPYSVQVQFIESVDPVDLTVWADREVRVLERNVATNKAVLSLPIPKFPFDLDQEGFVNVPIGLYGMGLCSELQIELSGIGNWTLFQIKCTAFLSQPLTLT